MIIYNNQAAGNGVHTMPYEVQMGYIHANFVNYVLNSLYTIDINASTETCYPNKNGNSMNKKLEAAKKWLESRKK